MELKIKTIELQDMISKSIKGASQNKLIPLTSLMKIEVKNKELSLVTTNMSDYLYIKQKVDAEDFYVVVQVDQFSKLISKMSSETIILDIIGNILTIKGNGTYKIELPLDEQGEMIKYPDPVAKMKLEGEESATINLATIKSILATNKAALAVTMEVPVYTGYYVGDRVITTDSFKMCSLNEKLFDHPVMISAETMNLLDVMTEEKVTVDFAGDIILFSTSNCVLYSHLMEGLEEFAIEPITQLLDEKFTSYCKVSKNTFISLLERIALFVGPYDNKAITLTFTDKGIDVSSKKSDGVETIPYIENTGNPYICSIDILMLTQQIKANVGDTIQIQYGNDDSIKIVDGKVTQAIALLEDTAE